MTERVVDRIAQSDGKLIYKNGEWKEISASELAERAKKFYGGAQCLSKGKSIGVFMSPGPHEAISVIAGGVTIFPFYFGSKKLDPYYVEKSEVHTIVTDSTPTTVETLKRLDDTYTIISTDEKYKHDSGNLKIIPFEYVSGDCKGDENYMLFTSGTTGDSKLVILTQKNISKNIDQFEEFVDYYGAKGKKIYNPLPWFHSYGLTIGVLGPLALGMQPIIGSGLKNVMSDLKETQPYGIIYVPLFYYKFKNEVEKSMDKKLNGTPKFLRPLIKWFLYNTPGVKKKIRGELGNAKLLVSGGAAIDKDVKSFYRKFAHLINGYGITEASPLIAVDDGKYFRFVKDINHEVVDGVLYVSGDNISPGYYKGDNIGWLDTGDIIVKHGNRFEIVGRKKNIIVLPNGENVSPEKIENKFQEFGYVAKVVEKGGKLVAIVDDRLSPIPAKEDLKKINKELPIHERVSNVVKGEIDMTPTFKIKRT